MASKILFVLLSLSETRLTVTQNPFLSQYTALLLLARTETLQVPLLPWLIGPILTGHRKGRSLGTLAASWAVIGSESSWSLARQAAVPCRTCSFGSDFAQSCNFESAAFPLPFSDQRQKKTLESACLVLEAHFVPVQVRTTCGLNTFPCCVISIFKFHW